MYKSTFMGLNTALRGVLAQQTNLDVTGHNLSNIETKGYTRQRAEMQASVPWSTPAYNTATSPGQLGTGVEVTSLERLRDRFIDQNVRQQFGRQASSQTMVDQLSQVEAAFQEPGENGLSALMKNFWLAMEDVAATPDGTTAGLAARQAFAEATDALAAGFRQVDTDLRAIQAQSDQRLNQTVTDINTISSRIAALNTEIARSIRQGQQPNDLLDQRDVLMDDLSKQINFSWSEASTGEVTITFGTTTPINLVDPLVAGGTTALTRAALDTAAGNGDLTSGAALADEQLWDPAGAAGTAGTGIIDTLRGRLDTLVADFVADINTAHAGGFDLGGAAGGNVFDPAALTAGTMRLDPANNILTNPRLIAAASSWGGTGEPGNGQALAGMLANLRGAAQGALGGATWESFYSSTVTGLGSQAAGAQRSLENADALVELAVGRRDQVSGVSLDEEMSNMLRFQHAYNASARVLTTMDEALDTIINRMGRVGL